LIWGVTYTIFLTSISSLAFRRKDLK